jgi:hypothetical protein
MIILSTSTLKAENVIMPLNTLRLNHQKSSHPNDRIVFIKPLVRPPSQQAEYDIADTFLRAIAAQCLPLMKKHYLSVTTLEEYEPNPEFIGRNFNNGEIIQLVLRSKSGQWVPFNLVQMVMMHELAHNSHMNHGKLFWQTRNLYASEMKALWAKGYTGEGFWGSGRTLDEMGVVMGNNILSSQDLEDLPLCGGTYRSRRRKRKARGTQDASNLSWREKEDRRIERKFGKNGVALGEDEDQRLTLEFNKKGPIGGKPRVAQSKRGRELRAAAALARFETNNTGVENIPKHQDSDAEDDEYEDIVDAGQEDALDLNGERLLDGRGQGMVRVCDDDDTDDINVKQEMTELENLNRYFKPIQQPTRRRQISAEGRIPERDQDRDANDDDPGLMSGEMAKSDTCAPENNHQRDQDPLSSASSYPVPVSSPVTGVAQAPGDQTWTPDKITPTQRGSSLKPAVPPRSMALSSKETKRRPTTVNSNHSLPASTSSAPPIEIETPSHHLPPLPSSTTTTLCAICSLENPRFNATCLACAHVIDPSKDPRHWSCKSKACKETSTGYLNAGDAGVCGICGARRFELS